MTGAGDERRRASTGEGFADSVTLAFGDPGGAFYGVARLGAAGDQGSALAVLFRDREPIAAIAEGGLPLDPEADWADLAVDRIHTTVGAPLERWTVEWKGERDGFALAFEAISAPAPADGGGMQGYTQLCRVTGEVRAGGETHAVDGLGERRHEWGVPDWEGLELVRTVSVWLGEEHGGVSLTSLRPAGAHGHDEEHVSATVVDAGEPVRVEDPRLSTTYDGDGHQRRAGLELWVTGEDAHPHRLAGEVICGSSLELGAIHLEMAFMRWHGDGAHGVGRYDILRRA
jgi:hypothetical protein